MVHWEVHSFIGQQKQKKQKYWYYSWRKYVLEIHLELVPTTINDFTVLLILFCKEHMTVVSNYPSVLTNPEIRT